MNNQTCKHCRKEYHQCITCTDDVVSTEAREVGYCSVNCVLDEAEQIADRAVAAIGLIKLRDATHQSAECLRRLVKLLEPFNEQANE